MTAEKDMLRQMVWSKLEDADAVTEPRPCFGRIPNFVGADIAARRLAELEIYKSARVVSVNPDSAQRPVRELVIADGKRLLVGTPKLQHGFMLLEDLKEKAREASTIVGMQKYGTKIPLREVPTIDLKVVGSVAVSIDGGRLGKGSGYFDLGYGILTEIGAIADTTPIVTTVHELQIVKTVPMMKNDVPVDWIVTPERTILTKTRIRKPARLLWSHVSKEDVLRVPMLTELKRLKQRGDL